ncbi:MAG: hypothetical protein ACTSSE_07085 [Candidatus Thorarchaeota archaeon]
MTIVKGVVREVGRSRTTRVSAQRWYGSTEIVIQDETTKKTYTVRISANIMDKCRYLPRVGVPVIVHGYVEEAEYGLSDFLITRVTDIKREGEGIKRVYKLD